MHVEVACFNMLCLIELIVESHQSRHFTRIHGKRKDRPFDCWFNVVTLFQWSNMFEYGTFSLFVREILRRMSTKCISTRRNNGGGNEGGIDCSDMRWYASRRRRPFRYDLRIRLGSDWGCSCNVLVTTHWRTHFSPKHTIGTAFTGRGRG